MTKYSLIVLMPLILLLGCSNGDDKVVDKSHLLDGHKKAMDKAKSLDKVIQDGLDKRREAIE